MTDLNDLAARVEVDNALKAIVNGGSWMCAEEMSIEEAGAVNRAMHDRWLAQTGDKPPFGSSNAAWADLAAVAIKTLRALRACRERAENGNG